MRTFTASTGVPVLAFSPVLASYIKVPDVANNDAQDINAKHLNFKTIFAITPKIRNSVSTIVVILYPVTTYPVEIMLNNVKQNLQSGQLHHWATSNGAEITSSLFVLIHSSQGISNPIRRNIQRFRAITQLFQSRARVLPLSIGPPCMTRKKTAR